MIPDWWDTHHIIPIWFWFGEIHIILYQYDSGLVRYTTHYVNMILVWWDTLHIISILFQLVKDTLHIMLIWFRIGEIHIILYQYDSGLVRYTTHYVNMILVWWDTLHIISMWFQLVKDTLRIRGILRYQYDLPQVYSPCNCHGDHYLGLLSFCGWLLSIAGLCLALLLADPRLMVEPYTWCWSPWCLLFICPWLWWNIYFLLAIQIL